MVFYGTFGPDHVHFIDGHGFVEMRDYYVTIESDSYQGARMKMLDRFGDKWSMIYNEDEFRFDLFPSGNIMSI